MISTYRREEVVERPFRPISVPAISVTVGLALGLVFSWLWPDVSGLAAWALWPLGMATGLISVTLLASVLAGRDHWDLLIVGKAFAVAGAILLFVSSLG